MYSHFLCTSVQLDSQSNCSVWGMSARAFYFYLKCFEVNYYCFNVTVTHGQVIINIVNACGNNFFFYFPDLLSIFNYLSPLYNNSLKYIYLFIYISPATHLRNIGENLKWLNSKSGSIQKVAQF